MMLSTTSPMKFENMLILGLLLDSREIKADNINHYLSSIIDELLRFWKEDSYLQTVSLRKSALAPT